MSAAISDAVANQVATVLVLVAGVRAAVADAVYDAPQRLLQHCRLLALLLCRVAGMGLPWSPKQH